MEGMVEVVDSMVDTMSNNLDSIEKNEQDMDNHDNHSEHQYMAGYVVQLRNDVHLPMEHHCGYKKKTSCGDNPLQMVG